MSQGDAGHRDNSYAAVMARKNEIMKASMGMDYDDFVQSPIAFDYERMMRQTGYSHEDIVRIQAETKVGNTPLFELRNLTELVRSVSPAGKGARILVKDEAANASGSFKARRAAISAFEAKKKGYNGIIAATSGNYGAAVASQAAQRGLKCIIVQEVFDSRYVGQPEIVEKGRACEAYGAEVMKLSVGPELFYVLLRALEDTGFFNASLYTPFGIRGVETLGTELAAQVRAQFGREPDAVVATHAGGGNLTGTARGLLLADCKNTRVVACSVDLGGLHMASDHDFNRKSFTTGHTGFGVPFATWPDRVDVPRNAARSLRYMDEYQLVTQGEVFYVTELLTKLEGLERGPAGNISLTAAVTLARGMDRDQVVVVQETEYTGAGKHHNSQLSFARANGVEVRRGDPDGNVPGKTIVIPESIDQVRGKPQDMERLRLSYLKNAAKALPVAEWSAVDYAFVALDLKQPESWVRQAVKKL
ncbi:MAG: PLP-dependent lyase/thiolase [Spirochaetes bacterium GWD1_61_31]|nr:MAG: PLP-dependent lyase/thiolase [Spirochaetes bacterium GWB1_60_80]OHD34931.1 MAG: PLP-dependent lyase/thiolase [Spirochaetes bacterium GWC1_61_12]OHD37039.1 MAG: PLP-dependent lyase/thiolase [Spirochaetes bacterium GWD1_61_31]OHD45350.1 MAG: PLP-dependent lyase/thiolase [Spirochaetes bacterium GWE1_60_18]OHD61102.1 MAG: PLP-dependent lyase/thiolase [Spirochaetes bacterium GWF1_60_12]HAP42766.1 PLP-dependent lyase/thiolase [Spirochaetaceae bacterium]